jgi:hypothetical protein
VLASTSPATEGGATGIRSRDRLLQESLAVGADRYSETRDRMFSCVGCIAAALGRSRRSA